VNPYEVLAVSRDASAEDIKQAYRKLARETHPDLNPGDADAEARFKQISVAYDVLGDATRRTEYDEFGEIALRTGFDADTARAERERFNSRFGSADPASFGQGFEFGGLEDLFRQFEGRRGFGESASLRMRGSDLESSMTLGFLEAVRGGERRISLSRPGPGGSLSQQSITVRIPPGVTDGGRLRIPGKGGLGSGGGAPGDLWIAVRVEPHAVFRRDAQNLEFDLPITLAEAVAGAKIEVPTLDGRAMLTVPAATSSHTRLRLRGKGIPAGNGRAAGDLLARIQIIVPKDVPSEVLEVLEGCEQSDPRKELFR
jgi:curved DNA-binding protein